MQKDIWENFIALNCDKDSVTETLCQAKEYYDVKKDILEDFNEKEILNALEKDKFPLPKKENREGYNGENHFLYWLSGLRDYNMIANYAKKYGIDIKQYFDLGSASGRVVRHFACQHEKEIKIYAADINRLHVDWINDFLGNKITAFHCSSIPHLPFEDNSLDVITAFSVFSHVETFDTTWLMEIKRVLKPKGIFIATIHSQNAWNVRNEENGLNYGLRNLPLFKKYKDLDFLPKDRLIFRWHKDMSYTANVFYTQSYIERVWGSVMNLLEFKEKLHAYQDAVILQK